MPTSAPPPSPPSTSQLAGRTIAVLVVLLTLGPTPATNADLARLSGYSIRSVRYAVADLRRRGLVSVGGVEDPDRPGAIRRELVLTNDGLAAAWAAREARGVAR